MYNRLKHKVSVFVHSETYSRFFTHRKTYMLRHLYEHVYSFYHSSPIQTFTVGSGVSPDQPC